MGKCGHCGAETTFFGNSESSCEAEGCEETGCDSCKNIKECSKCGWMFCTKHYSEKAHNCEGETKEETDSEDESEEEQERVVVFFGKNKEFAVMSRKSLESSVEDYSDEENYSDEIKYANGYFDKIVEIESKGYELSEVLSTDEHLIFRKVGQ